MDVNGGHRYWRIVAVGACLSVILPAPACTHEVQPIGPPAVRFEQKTREPIAAAKILRDGEPVGSLRTFRVRASSGDRVLHQVQDLYLNPLGFIDEQNCAFRITAHTGPELVANSSDRRRNVAAILGAYGSQIELIEEEVASPVTTPSPAASPRSPR
jgi:hypothetical protein